MQQMLCCKEPSSNTVLDMAKHNRNPVASALEDAKYLEMQWNLIHCYNQAYSC